MEPLREGFDVFLHDGDKAFGAVRQLRHNAIMVYVENASDFEVPLAAVQDVHDEKVVLDAQRLDARLREAIRRAHGGEDPRIP
jgi:hypothetical protein